MDFLSRALADVMGRNICVEHSTLLSTGVGAISVVDVMARRHSIRAYSSEPVPLELIEKLMTAASLAPSAFNNQPWRYYIATGESRRKLGEIMVQGTHFLEDYLHVIGHEMNEWVLKWYSELGQAPVVIACTLPVTDDELQNLNGYLATGSSIQNMLLAATEIGLGSCYLTFSYWVSDEIAKMLEVPEDRTIVALIALGYPEEDPVAPPREVQSIAVYRD